jgi:hypothetical protein
MSCHRNVIILQECCCLSRHSLGWWWQMCGSHKKSLWINVCAKINSTTTKTARCYIFLILINIIRKFRWRCVWRPSSAFYTLCTQRNHLSSAHSPSFFLDSYHHTRRSVAESFDSNNINQNFSSEPSQPYFDFAVIRNVTTRVGQTAFLHCRVEDLGDKLVSENYEHQDRSMPS